MELEWPPLSLANSSRRPLRQTRPLANRPDARPVLDGTVKNLARLVSRLLPVAVLALEDAEDVEAALASEDAAVASAA